MTDIHEKPGTPQEILHYGVKGMQWGVRKNRSGTGKGKGLAQRNVDRHNARKSQNKKIKDARARQEKRLQEATKSELRLYKSMVTGGRKAAYREMRDAYDNVNYNKDAALANRMTSGEKVATTLLAGGAAALFLTSYAAVKEY